MNYRNYYPMACKKIDNYHKMVDLDNILGIDFQNKIVVGNKVVEDTHTGKEVAVVEEVVEEVEVVEQWQLLEVELLIVE
jgi:hypothetical protein